MLWGIHMCIHRGIPIPFFDIQVCNPVILLLRLYTTDIYTNNLCDICSQIPTYTLYNT